MDRVTWKDDAPARTESLWGEEEEVKSLDGSLRHYQQSKLFKEGRTKMLPLLGSDRSVPTERDFFSKKNEIYTNPIL